MDDTQGRFVIAEEQERLKKLAQDLGLDRAVERAISQAGIFSVGERLSVRGSHFQIESISSDGKTVLQLLPRPSTGA